MDGDHERPHAGERTDDVTDVTVVARRALDRWAVVEQLGLSPRRGLDPGTAFARLVHPTASATDVVLLVRGPVDLAWLRRVHRAMGGRPRGRLLAVLDDAVDEDEARRAGADAVLRRVGDDVLGAAIEDRLHRLDATVLLLPDTAPAPA